MEKKIINEEFPIYYKEIAKRDTSYKHIGEIIAALQTRLADNPSAQVIAVFNLYDHVRMRDGQVADEILGAQNLLFCVANAIPNSDLVALRPRSIGLTEFADRFVLNFMEAPAHPVTETMRTLIEAVVRDGER